MEIGVVIAIILMGGEVVKDIMMIEAVVGIPSVEEDAIETTSVVLFVIVLLIEAGIVGVLQGVVTTVDAAVLEVVHHP